MAILNPKIGDKVWVCHNNVLREVKIETRSDDGMQETCFIVGNHIVWTQGLYFFKTPLELISHLCDSAIFLPKE